MHRLDDHNRVIDHNRDGQHKRGQGDEVDREPDKLHHKERADKCHRYGNGRNDCGTYVLKEYVHDKEHKYERFDKRLYHLVD